VGNGGSKARLQLIIASLILRPLVTGRVVLRPFSTFLYIFVQCLSRLPYFEYNRKLSCRFRFKKKQILQTTSDEEMTKIKVVYLEKL
jgi:hypothetical protein